MISENKKLGRGLGALLSSGKNEKNNQNFKLINISEIKANKDQPRKDFKKEELEELASSIKSQGVLQPIVVRKKEGTVVAKKKDGCHVVDVVNSRHIIPAQDLNFHGR